MTGEKKGAKTKKSPDEESVKAKGEAAAEEKVAEEAVEKAEEIGAEVTAEREETQIEGEPEGPAEEEKTESVVTEGDLKKPLDKMTAKELREVALGIPEISGAHAMKKEELLAAITKAWGVKAEKAPEKARKAKATVHVADLKAKIREIKAKRAEAIERKDKRMAGVYRRKINRLKKRTRRAA